MNRSQTRQVANQRLIDAASSSKEIQSCVGTNQNKSSAKTEDTILYITGEVTSGGKIELFRLLKDQIQRVGITNFDGNQLNQGRNAVIDAIAVETATTAAVATETAEALEFGAAKADLAIQNANLTFEVDGKKVIEFPVYEVHNTNTTRTNDEKYRQIGHTPIIEAQKSLKLELDFPVGVTPDVALRHFVKVSFRVNQTISR